MAKKRKKERLTEIRKKPMAARFRDVHLICRSEPVLGDDDDANSAEDDMMQIYTLTYIPNCKGGQEQRYQLEAGDAANAKFEAASMLECEESELPEIEHE